MAKKTTGYKRKAKGKKKPYVEAPDDEKVVRNWTKACGLFSRSEYSVAVIRCGTCIELAVNSAIRRELVSERKLPQPFVNSLLKSANGLSNKYQNLLLPIMTEHEEFSELKRLWKTHVEPVNQQRNAVAHSGEFRSRRVAERIMTDTYGALTKIMELHNLDGKLKPFVASTPTSSV